MWHTAYFLSGFFTFFLAWAIWAIHVLMAKRWREAQPRRRRAREVYSLTSWGTRGLKRADGGDTRQWLRGRTHRTARGDLVRSQAERRIADFLHAQGIDYDYEPVICGFRPDFYIPDWNVIIEYWGMTANEYQRDKAEKLQRYEQAGHLVIGLDGADYAELEHRLAERLALHRVT